MRFRLVPRDDGFFPLFDQAAENLAEGAQLKAAEANVALIEE